jgi:hypothetical protein
LVVIKGLLHLRHNFSHQLSLIEDGGQAPADRGAGFEGFGALGHTLLQTGQRLLQLVGHFV